MTNDTKLQQEVQSAIHALPLLKTEEIDVVAQVGVITLIGVVDSIARKIQVEDLTRKIHGVESVIGNITINPVEPKNSDENKRINETIDVFQHNPELPNEKINVKVQVGDAILEGELKWHDKDSDNLYKNPLGSKRKLQKNVKSFLGSDEKAKNEIKYELVRNWSIDDEKIQVTVSNHKVTLKGTVPSMYQRNEVGRIAYNTQGICAVDNELEIIGC